MNHLTLQQIRQTLSGHRPCLAGEDFPKKASVALILRSAPQGPEVLFIRRAEHPGDPWSGDIGFPGGRIDPEDSGPRQAAERETSEEMGLDLQDAEFLGRLDDIAGAFLPVRISCFVYCLQHRPKLVPNAEVRDYFWYPLQRLTEESNHRAATFNYRGHNSTHPAIDLLGPGAPLLWGITYRLVTGFLELLGHRPPENPRAVVMGE